MFIKTLFSKNACNYKSLSLDFEKGTTLINGRNKSGKSSILDILLFSIYGDCQKSKKLKNFIKRGCKSAYTRIVFMFKEAEWDIEREINGKTSTATLKIGGEIVASGSNEVSLYINENFNSYELFTNSNLANQRDMTKLMGAVPSARFKMFSKIFDLDYFQTKAQEIKKDLDLEKESNAQIQSMLIVLDQNHQNATDKVGGIAISTLREELKVFESRVEELKLKEKGNDLKIATVTAVLENIQRENELIKQHNSILEGYSNTCGSVEKNILGSMTEIEHQRDNIVKYRKEIETSKGKGEESKVLLDNIVLARLLNINEDKYRETLCQIAGCNQSLKTLQGKKAFVEKGICPECKQVIHNISLEDVGREMKEVSDTLAKLQEEEKEFVEARIGFDIQKELNHKKTLQKVELENKIQNLKENISRTEGNILYSEEIIQKETDKIKGLEKEKEEVEAKLKNLSKKDLLEDISVQKELEGLYSIKQEIEKSLGEELTQISRIHETIRDYDSLIKTLEEIKVSQQEYNTKLVKSQALLNDLEQVKDIFEKKLPLFMVLYKLKIIEEEANKFLHKIDKQFIIRFENSSKDSLDIIITDIFSGEESPSENLSGFEEVLIGLAIRVGLSHYNNYFNKRPIHWFAADEPDKSADETSAALLFKSLNELSKEFSQMFIVTHTESIKDTLYGAKVVNVHKDFDSSYAEGV